MSIQCPGCKEPLKWWQRKEPPTNDSWHRRCWLSWEEGYTKAYNHCANLNEENRLPEPHELYCAKNNETVLQIVQKKIKQAGDINCVKI